MKSTKGQVWVETVIYTLIAFALIGAVLAIAKPKIEEIQDTAIIKQSVGMMEDLNGLILSVVQGGSGNKRKIEIGIKKGGLEIDGIQDTVSYSMEGLSKYSEPGQDISWGSTVIRTDEIGDMYRVSLLNNYSGQYNISFDDRQTLKTLTKSATPYKIFISNNGLDQNNKPIINIELI